MTCRAGGWLGALLLVACSRDRDVEQRSVGFATAKERVDFLCQHSMCPTPPLDAAFHLYNTDEGTVVHGIARIDPLDAPKWSMGCDHFTVEARPKWVNEVLPAGWSLKSTPDLWRCGGERRVIHVKDGIVIRALLRPH